MKIHPPYPNHKTSLECPPELAAIFRAAFPDYCGRKFRLEVTTSVRCNDTWWDGGSKSDYAFVQLSTGVLRELPDFISGGFLPGSAAAHKALSSVQLSVDCAIVQHSIFCGKDMGLRVFLHPDNVVKLLPAAAEKSFNGQYS